MDRRLSVPAIAGALALGLGAVALSAANPDAVARGLVGGPAQGLLVGWSFAAAGLAATALGPRERFGILLFATGMAWFLSALMAADAPLLFTLGLAAAPWWLGLFLHALLAFPDGRLADRLRRGLVALLYVDVTLLQVVRLLFTDANDLPGCGDCPPNVLLVADRPDVATALLVVQQAAIGSLVIAGTLVALARGWARATRPLRRALAPVLVTGAASLVVQGVALTTAPASVRQSLGWVGALAFAAVPLAFLAGLLRQRLDRSAVGRLVVDLGERSNADSLDELLRNALKDPSLEVAYWHEGSREYVDAAGHPIFLPSPDGPRVVTAVERNGRRIAAVVHDRSVDDPALVSGVVAAAGMALENQRLHAEVRARLEELSASRRRLVEAADQERRRLERNLHDGAQQRLLAVSLMLSRLERTDDPAARTVAAEARAELARSLEELRELARGLHPAVLTDYGLAVALEGLAARAPLKAELDVDLPGRAPAPAEVAAYYVVSEALANVVKHAAATCVSVRVRTEDGTLRVRVVDDGVGGADQQAGSGLLGLRDRLAALDGRLAVTSPRGQGTTVEAVIPCG